MVQFFVETIIYCVHFYSINACMLHLLLSESVSVRVWLAVSHLQVILWVPVRVKDDAGVCCCKVDPQATSSGTQKENETLRVGLTKAVDSCLPKVSTHASIYPLVQVPENGKTIIHF